jgi:hypothetical protein
MATNHNKKEFRNMRGVVLWLHNNKCYNCDDTYSVKDVHHLDHKSVNNDLCNLVPLCPPCHKLFHKINTPPAVKPMFIVTLLLKKVNLFLK